MKYLENFNQFIIGNHGYYTMGSHQLVRKIPVQQFLDGEQDDGALFLFPEARDFPLGVLAVSTSAELRGTGFTLVTSCLDFRDRCDACSTSAALLTMRVK